MIINRYSDYRQSYYYVGACILQILPNNKTMQPQDIFDKIKPNVKCEYSLFINSLNWLYAIGVIDYNDNEKGIIKCS